MARHGQYSRKPRRPLAPPPPREEALFGEAGRLASLPAVACEWALGFAPRNALAAALRYDWSHALHAAVELGAPAEVVEALLAAPGALERAREGELPLLAALKARAPATTALRLLDAHPGAARWCPCARGAGPPRWATLERFGAAAPGCGGCGHQLPLHAAAAAGAAPEVVAALIAAHPEAARARFAGAGTPLHVAAAARAEAGVVLALLSAHPGAAAERSAALGAGDVPLLLALRSGAPAASVAALLAAHPPAALAASGTDGASPLTAALCAPPAHAAAPETVAALLAADPSAAARAHPRGAQRGATAHLAGALPLHAAAAALAPLPVLSLLLAAHPPAAAAAVAGAKGWLPLHFAVAALAPPAHAPARPPLAGAAAAAEGAIPALLAAHPGAARVPFAALEAHPCGRGLFGEGGELVGALPLHVALAVGAPAAAVAALVDAFPEALGVWFGAAPGEDPRDPHFSGEQPRSKLPYWLAEHGGRGALRARFRSRKDVAEAVKSREMELTSQDAHGEGVGSQYGWSSEGEERAAAWRVEKFFDRAVREGAAEAAVAAGSAGGEEGEEGGAGGEEGGAGGEEGGAGGEEGGAGGEEGGEGGALWGDDGSGGGAEDCWGGEERGGGRAAAEEGRPSRVVQAALAAGLDLGGARTPCAVCGCAAEFSADGERACFCDACARGGCRLHASYDDCLAKTLAIRFLDVRAPPGAQSEAEAQLLQRQTVSAVRALEGRSAALECELEGDRAFFRGLTEARVDRALAKVKVAIAAERAAERLARFRFAGCLPLHVAALARAPAAAVAALLARPAAAAERSAARALPLHATCAAGAGEDVIALLLAANPGAARERAPCAALEDELRAPPPPPPPSDAAPEKQGGWLRGGWAPLSPPKPEGWLPLEIACASGAPEGAVAALLAAHPEALHCGTALRAACLHKAPAGVVRLLLAARPAAAALPAENGMLAIHFAAMRRGGEKRERGWERGAPAPSASAEVLAALLAAHPPGDAPAPPPPAPTPYARRQREPPSPFAVACGTRAGADVVRALLAADPGAAARRPEGHCKFFAGLFPDTLRDSASEQRATWLHAVCADPDTPGEVVEAVLRAAPAAARVSLRRELRPAAPAFVPWGGGGGAAAAPPAPPAALEEHGELPLHLACLRRAPGAAIPALVAAFPEAARAPWRGTFYERDDQRKPSKDQYGRLVQHGNGALPLELALEKHGRGERAAAPPAAIGALLSALTLCGGDGGEAGAPLPAPPPGSPAAAPDSPASTPLSASSALTPTSPLSFSRGGAALDTDALVAFLLERGEAMGGAFSACCDALGAAGALHAAIGTPNSAGRTPYGVAGPLCRAEIRRRLFLRGRFELQECAHASATSRVLLAVDWGAGRAKGTPVALKFMRHGEHFAAELRAPRPTASSPRSPPFRAQTTPPSPPSWPQRGWATFPFAWSWPRATARWRTRWRTRARARGGARRRRARARRWRPRSPRCTPRAWCTAT